MVIFNSYVSLPEGTIHNINPINWWSNGVPLCAKEYIHRLGRTGRAGANGQGLLLLHDFERGAKG